MDRLFVAAHDSFLNTSFTTILATGTIVVVACLLLILELLNCLQSWGVYLTVNLLVKCPLELHTLINAKMRKLLLAIRAFLSLRNEA